MVTSGQPVPVLLAPTRCGMLVLPSGMVCEVITNQRISRIPATRDWVTGYIVWRGIPVSVISVERLLGFPDASEIHKLVVLYPLRGREQHDFFAITTCGDPHTMSIGMEAKLGNSATLSSRYIVGLLELQEGVGFILDFEALRSEFFPD